MVFHARRMLDLGRLVVGAFMLLLGFVAVLPAANDRVWQLSVVVTEGGHWAMLVWALLLVPRWRCSRVGISGVVAAGLGTVLLLTPVLRAISVAQALPAAIEEHFGSLGARASGADSRSAPLVLSSLVGLGRSLPPVAVEQHVYSAQGGTELGLDLYRPVGTQAQLPGVVIIHGGSWQGGSRQDFPALNRYLAARGHLVAAISYRLAPRFPFPAARDDVAAAVAFLKRNASRLGLDADRLVLIGRSAGGQLALVSAYMLRDPAIKGVVSYYGPIALRWGYANPAKLSIIDSSAILDAYLGGSPETHAVQYQAASPLSHVGHGTPPTLLINGLRDELVSPFHAEFLSDRLLRARVPHLYLRLPWATHGCDYLFYGPCGQVTTYAVDRFLAAVL